MPTGGEKSPSSVLANSSKIISEIMMFMINNRRLLLTIRATKGINYVMLLHGINYAPFNMLSAGFDSSRLVRLNYDGSI